MLEKIHKLINQMARNSLTLPTSMGVSQAEYDQLVKEIEPLLVHKADLSESELTLNTAHGPVRIKPIKLV